MILPVININLFKASKYDHKKKEDDKKDEINSTTKAKTDVNIISNILANSTLIIDLKKFSTNDERTLNKLVCNKILSNNQEKEKLISINKEKEKIEPIFFYVKFLLIKYAIIPGNNCSIIKKCMSHRTNWKECQSNANYFNFKWQPVSASADYDSFNNSSSTKQVLYL